MCYVIEFGGQFDNHFKEISKVKITAKVLNHVKMKELNVWVIAQYDYLGIAIDNWGDNKPEKINVEVGKDQIPKITSHHYEKVPLECNSDPRYVSVQQSIVEYFSAKAFSPCPIKVQGYFNFQF